MDEVVKYRIVGGAILIVLAICVLPIVIRLPYRETHSTALTTLERRTPENQYVAYDESGFAEDSIPNESGGEDSHSESDVVVAIPVPPMPKSPSTTRPATIARTIERGPVAKTKFKNKAKTNAHAKAKTVETKVAQPRLVKPIKKGIKPHPAVMAKTVGNPRKVVVAHPVAMASKWVVQLASFSQPKNATAFRDALRRQGYQAHLAVEAKAGRRLQRVYVGPVLNRTQANQLAVQLQRTTHMTGLVVRYHLTELKETR